MARDVVLLGLDPGFESYGWAKLAVTEATIEVRGMGLFLTSLADKKKNVSVVIDDFRRAREIAAFLAPLVEGVDAVCIEGITPFKHASIMKKMGYAWGATAAAVEAARLPVAMATPAEIKKAACGVKDASKEDVQAAMERLFPPEGGLTLRARFLPGMVAKDKLEHPFDALACIMACFQSDIIRATVRAITHQQTPPPKTRKPRKDPLA